MHGPPCSNTGLESEDVMLLLLIGWVVLACLLALLIGSAIHQGAELSDAPAHVSNRHWQQVTERHVPMGTFRRVQ
jgi:hypothetical protein